MSITAVITAGMVPAEMPDAPWLRGCEPLRSLDDNESPSGHVVMDGIVRDTQRCSTCKSRERGDVG